MTIETSGSFPTSVWDAQASQQLGMLVANLIKERTAAGRGDADVAMKPYSTDPLKMYHRTNSARRLKPKGGTPFNWVKGPRKVDGTYDETKIGQEGGRFYTGGYAQYKKASRKGLTSKSGKVGAEVDLTLSGQMLRQFGITRHGRYSVTIGLKGQSREYGSFVDRSRPWIAVSPENGREVELVLPGIVAGAQKRAGGGNGAA